MAELLTVHPSNYQLREVGDIQDQHCQDFYGLYRKREDAITLISQLNGLIIAVQKHRGISMGLIGGNNVFEGNFSVLQAQFERRLATLEVFAKDSKLLTQKDKQNLHQAWTTISDDWQEDDINVNFELHSHFIEQLLAMVWQLAQTLERQMELLPNSEEPQATIAAERAEKRKQVLLFASKNLPQIIELVGKVRGLSTYSAAAGEVSDVHGTKLRFLLQCIRKDSALLRKQAQSLDKKVGGVLTALTGFKDIELNLNYFLNTVEKDLLSASASKANSSELFALATKLIDNFWVVVNQGLSLFRQWQGEDMELWLNQ